MDHLTPDRLLIVGLFLAALLGAWALVQRKGAGLARRMAAGRRLRLVEALALGPEGRALLIEAEGRMVLVVTGRRGPAQVLALADAPPAAGSLPGGGAAASPATTAPLVAATTPAGHSA